MPCLQEVFQILYQMACFLQILLIPMEKTVNPVSYGC